MRLFRLHCDRKLKISEETFRANLFKTEHSLSKHLRTCCCVGPGQLRREILNREACCATPISYRYLYEERTAHYVQRSIPPLDLPVRAAREHLARQVHSLHLSTHDWHITTLSIRSLS
jgi:hypothetical protein